MSYDVVSIYVCVIRLIWNTLLSLLFFSNAPVTFYLAAAAGYRAVVGYRAAVGYTATAFYRAAAGYSAAAGCRTDVGWGASFLAIQIQRHSSAKSALKRRWVVYSWAVQLVHNMCEHLTAISLWLVIINTVYVSWQTAHTTVHLRDVIHVRLWLD